MKNSIVAAFLMLLTCSMLFALADKQAGGDRIFPTPADALKSPPEKLAYVVATYAGTDVKKPDYLATIDVDPQSKTYSQVIHRLQMPNVGDELHHFGWNACASCEGRCDRRYLIIPGLASSRIHIVDTMNPRAAEDAQGDRAGGRDRARSKLTAPAHGPLPGRRPDHDLDARRRQGRRPRRLPAAERQVRGHRPLGSEPRRA